MLQSVYTYGSYRKIKTTLDHSVGYMTNARTENISVSIPPLHYMHRAVKIETKLDLFHFLSSFRQTHIYNKILT